jgi:DNA-binding SARP family transcriptional activator
MEVAVAFWPEADHSKARNNFHQKVSQIRQRLGERLRLAGDEIISQGPDGYRLNPALVWVDALAFERLVEEADVAVDEERVMLLHQAVALYLGDLMGAQAPDWAQPKVQDLRNRHLDAVWELSRWDEENGDLPGALSVASRLVRFDPLREVYHRRLMQLYAKAGDVGAVERSYGDLCTLLRDELDTAPSDETLRLYRHLRKKVSDQKAVCEATG